MLNKREQNPKRQVIRALLFLAVSIVVVGTLSACSTLSTDGTLLLAKGGVVTPAWKQAGIPSSQVASWVDHGFTASEAAKWQTALTSYSRDTAGQAARWRGAGFSPSQAVQWVTAFTAQISPQQAALWRGHGFSAKAAGSWSSSGFSPRSAQVWKKAGVDNASEAAAWSSSDFTPHAAEVWTTHGFTSANKATPWLHNGLADPATAGKWRELIGASCFGNGYTSSSRAAGQYVKAGIARETVASLKGKGADVCNTKQTILLDALLKHGYAFKQAQYYAAHGVAPSDVKAFQRTERKDALIRKREQATRKRVEAAWRPIGVVSTVAGIASVEVQPPLWRQGPLFDLWVRSSMPYLSGQKPTTLAWITGILFIDCENSDDAWVTALPIGSSSWSDITLLLTRLRKEKEEGHTLRYNALRTMERNAMLNGSLSHIDNGTVQFLVAERFCPR
ncbi:MAG: hypothetical protein ACYCXT_00185 [Acidiferrobacteraceae bacterium]